LSDGHWPVGRKILESINYNRPGPVQIYYLDTNIHTGEIK
jgi:hypothetical protein